MANLSKNKREKMLEYLKKLKEINNDDKNIRAITEIENALNEKKYGLVWEDHSEKVDEMLEHNIPIFVEDEKKKIVIDKAYVERERERFNFLLEGDNLHSLKLLSKTHKGKIDVIYIDPPYNTGNKDFIYDDCFVDRTDGYSHSKWLSFMQKRLAFARELLSDDGVIFISIDDNEQAQLRLLCDSIFSSNNFITQFIWEKTQHFGRQKINYYSNCEYILCYSKNIFNTNTDKLKELLVEKIKTDLVDAPLYNASNKNNKLRFKKGSVKFNLSDGIYNTTSNHTYVLLEPVVVKNGYNFNDLKLEFKSRWSQHTIDEEIAKGTTFWVKSNGFAIRAIYHEGKSANESPKQLIFTNANNPLCAYTRNGDKVGVNEEGSSQLSKIIKQNIFSYPKPVTLIKYLINLYYDYKNNIHKKDFLILDFFAGSGTTGHAVMQLNKEDGGNRKYILCTNNENNICENVTYQRLKNIQAELPHNLKYFKTDFISKYSNDEDEKTISEKMLEHIKELIELEHHIEIDNEKYIILDDEDKLESILKNIQQDGKLFVLPGIFWTRAQQRIINEKNISVIEVPEYYFRNELRKAGELW